MNIASYIFILCLSHNIHHPEIVTSQFILETGYGKSNVFNTKNNLFGFFYKGQYIHFKSHHDCLIYYKDWQTKHYVSNFKAKNPSKTYYDFLQWRGYAEDTLYIKKVKAIVRKHNSLYNHIREGERSLKSLYIALFNEAVPLTPSVISYPLEYLGLLPIVEHRMKGKPLRHADYGRIALLWETEQATCLPPVKALYLVPQLRYSLLAY